MNVIVFHTKRASKFWIYHFDWRIIETLKLFYKIRIGIDHPRICEMDNFFSRGMVIRINVKRAKVAKRYPQGGGPVLLISPTTQLRFKTFDWSKRFRLLFARMQNIVKIETSSKGWLNAYERCLTRKKSV